MPHTRTPYDSPYPACSTTTTLPTDAHPNPTPLAPPRRPPLPTDAAHHPACSTTTTSPSSNPNLRGKLECIDGLFIQRLAQQVAQRRRLSWIFGGNLTRTTRDIPSTILQYMSRCWLGDCPLWCTAGVASLGHHSDHSGVAEGADLSVGDKRKGQHGGTSAIQ